MAASAQNLLMKGFSGRLAWAAVLCKEQRVVGVCKVFSSFLRKFRKNEDKRYVPWSLR